MQSLRSTTLLNTQSIHAKKDGERIQPSLTPVFMRKKLNMPPHIHFTALSDPESMSVNETIIPARIPLGCFQYVKRSREFTNFRMKYDSVSLFVPSMRESDLYASSGLSGKSLTIFSVSPHRCHSWK